MTAAPVTTGPPAGGADEAVLPVATPRQAWGLVWTAVRDRPLPLVVALISTIVAGLAGLVAPYAVGVLVERLSERPERGDVLAAGVALLVAAVGGGLFAWLGRWTIALVGERAVARLRADAVDHALRIDAATVEQAGTGEFVSRVADDSRLVATAAAQFVPGFVTALVAVVVSAVGLLGVDWRIGLVGLAAIPMYWTTLRWYLPRSGPLYAAERAALSRRAQHLLGGITGAETLRALGGDRLELARINDASATARDRAVTVFRLLTGLFARNNRAEAVVLSLILGLGFWFTTSGWLGAGAVATAALLFHRLFNPLGGIVVMFDQIQSAGASLVRLAGVILLPTRTALPIDPTAPIDPTPRVEPVETTPAVDTTGLRAVDLRHRYLDGDPEAVAGVSLTIGRGRVVALVGSTGAGKTTVATALAGMLIATGGRCELDGVDLTALDPAALRRRVCLVSQETYLFAGTVADNLRLARPDADDTAVQAALETALARSWVGELPEGIDTAIGPGAHRLSTVQAQHLALTRIALADPDFVILDEATAEAGSAGSQLLERAARAVLAGRGALVVAHRLSQAQQADEVIVMASGRIAEHGSHTDLVAAGGRYAELWEAWSAHR